jgi:peptidoglycan/xylan/chitin deacetylase (PgdA/CDA1 family)
LGGASESVGEGGAVTIALAYHRIVAAGGERHFYDVSEDLLAHQIEAARRAGLHFADPSKLADGPPGDEPRLLLSFDDATADHAAAARRTLDRVGARALFYAPSRKIGRPGRLSATELRGLESDGHWVGAHGASHCRLDLLRDEAELTAEMIESRDTLSDLLGRPVDDFAPPGGFAGPRVEATAGAAGFRTLRTLTWGYNRRWRPLSIEALPACRLLSGAATAAIFRGRGEALLRLTYFGKNLIRGLGAGYFALRSGATRLGGRPAAL